MKYKKYFLTQLPYLCKKIFFKACHHCVLFYISFFELYSKFTPAFVKKSVFYSLFCKMNCKAMHYCYLYMLGNADSIIFEKIYFYTIEATHFWLLKEYQIVSPLIDQECGNSLTLQSFLRLLNLSILLNPAQAKKILDEITIVAPNHFIAMAKYYFDINDFATSRKLLEQHDQEYPLEKNQVHKILRIENPAFSKIKDTYEVIDVASGKIHAFSLPKIFPARLINNEKKEVLIPSEKIFRINDASIYHGSIVTVHDDSSIFLYEPASHPSFGMGIMNNGQTLLYGSHWQFNHCIVNTYFDDNIELEAGILLDGRSSANYFHWLIEYLPRLYTIQKYSQTNSQANFKIKELPFIINDQLPPVYREALNILCPDANVFWHNKKNKLTVKDLYIPSFHTYHPDHVNLPFWKVCGFSEDHLAFLKNAIYERITVEKKPTKKIYLKRVSAIRNLLNSEEIEKMLQKEGFEIVDPGKLSFLAQAELFASAKVIVGSGGAAFTNLIFCQPACTVIGLISTQLENFCMQSNLAAFAKCNFIYVSGMGKPSLQTQLSPLNHIHADFIINPRKLEKALHYAEQ